MWTEPGLAMGTTWLLQVFFKIWISTQSSMTFAADRDHGALELLFSTPLTTSDLIRGHWLGLRRLFAVPLVFVTVICLLWTLWTIHSADDSRSQQRQTILLLCTCGANLVVLCADTWALGWLGLWMGVKSKNAHQASSRTQTRVLVFPWAAAMLSMSLSGRIFDFGEPAASWLFYWLGWSLFFDVKYVRMASRELQRSMRSAALERFAAQPGEGAGWMRGIRRLMAERN
jgi:ABC-type Na+ efflux pump permease subunit